MSTLRHETRRTEPGADWKQPSSPHGYDQPEFDPSQAPRDYRRLRAHGPDEERRRLRLAQEGLDDAGNTVLPSRAEVWDQEEASNAGDAPPSRLYRD